MLTIVTGLPGHGKTLNTLREVSARATRERRPVFFDGIPDLKLRWLPIPNVEEWHLVPDGALVVIDEAQRVFPPRPVGAPVPAKVRAFETHRHRGLDIYLVTQDAMLIDAHVRRLAGEHLHFRRAFGSRKVARLRWPEVKDPRDKADVRQAEKSFVELKREWFSQYRSATVHTVKRRIPWPVLALPLVVAGIVAAGWIGWQTLQGFKDRAAPEPAPSQQPATLKASASVVSTASGNEPKSAQQYIASFAPRVDGLQFSASAYDEITVPTRAPYPAMCIASEAKCRCYTDAGTRYAAPDRLCRQLAETGFYRYFDSQPPQPPLNQQASLGQRVPASGAAVAPPPQAVAPSAGATTAPAWGQQHGIAPPVPTATANATAQPVAPPAGLSTVGGIPRGWWSPESGHQPLQYR